MFDAKDGQLFNVAIQGPIHATNWTGNYKLLALPTDKVFVLVVADVYFAKYDDTTPGTKSIQDNTGDATAYEQVNNLINNSIDFKLEEYEEERKKLLNNGKNVIADKENFDESKFDPKKDAVMTNFRLRLSTSSEMVRFSGYGFGKPDDTRMGLMYCETGAEYVVGGWCIGSVLDSAAARASLPGMRGLYGSDTSPTSMALNLNVGIKWVTGDDLFRRFCNIEGKIKDRYNANTNGRISERNLGIDDILKPKPATPPATPPGTPPNPTRNPTRILESA